MAKKSYSVVPRDHPKRKALDELASFRYSDLKAAVIKRGIDFELVVSWDHGKLSDYFINNYDKPVNPKKLEEFDKWMDLMLKAKGYTENDPVRQFKQFTMPIEEEKEEKPKKKIEPKSIKPKKVKNKEFGIFGGTKKELTYSLSRDLVIKMGAKYDNKALIKKFSDQLFNKVKDKFPDANDKSVKIWFKRALPLVRK